MKNYINLSFCFLLFLAPSWTQTAAITYFCSSSVQPDDLVFHAEASDRPKHDMELAQRVEDHQLEPIDAIKNTKQMKVAVYMQEGMEILDFAGPVEVFTYAGMNVFTVGLTKEPILSQGVVTIVPEYSIKNCPKPDIIAFLGGNGTNASKNLEVQAWLKANAPKTKYLFSVCTGAFFLARAGLLDGLTATTFHSAIPTLKEIAPQTTVLDNARFVDNGNIITTAGVSAGIDGALYLVSKIFGMDRAKEVAQYMEYDKWNPKDGVIISK